MRSALAVFALVLLSLAPASTLNAQGNPCVMVNQHPNQATLPPATLNQPYSASLWITPANPCIPVIWTVSPPLPAGLNLVSTGSAQAVISGTPSALGTYTFTVGAQCTFICGTVCFLSKTYTIVVS